MDNIKTLEKRWYFYKIKKSLISLNTFAFGLMLSLGAYYMFIKMDSIESLFMNKTLFAETKSTAPEIVPEPVLEAKPLTLKCTTHCLHASR